jgi:glutamate racemase
MPHERIIYFGDTARSPYGDRSVETIQAAALQCAKKLVEEDVKLLVVACTTISSVALDTIEKNIRNIPVIGTVLPGARAAVLRTAERKIGVIGTSATIRTQSYIRAVTSIDSNVKVVGKACPLFVPLVEEGMIDHDITRLTAQFYLYEMVDIGVDCVILGCTHYTMLMEVIQGTVGTRIKHIDSAMWTAKEVQDILSALNGLTMSKTGGIESSRFLFTDIGSEIERMSRFFLGKPIPVFEKVDSMDFAE